MGVALGWMAVALAVVGGGPDTGRASAPIKYSVRYVETDGLQWREGVLTRLTPVTRQGSATIWTAPREVAFRLQQAGKTAHGPKIFLTPGAIASAGVPVHIVTRNDRRLVTQASWNGEDGTIATQPETVRTGTVATMTGRKIDQGVLVRVVLDDTQLLSVHKVSMASRSHQMPDHAATRAAYHVTEKTDKSAASTARFVLGEIEIISSAHGKSAALSIHRESPGTSATKSDPVALAVTHTHTQAHADCCTTAASCSTCSVDAETKAVSVEVPEIGNQEVAGEWLIPNNGILLVSFGPHTVADSEGKAAIRERLAIIEAEETTEVPGPPASVRLVAPPAPSAVVGPENFHGTAGEVVVPLVPAPGVFAPAPLNPAASGIVVPPPAAATPSTAAPVPPLPSRSLPQGYHSDGKMADLPPLPADDDDAEADADDDGSSEPRPTPQTKKPASTRKSSARARHRSSIDPATKKAQFTFPGIPSLPSLFESSPGVGLQFLMPIRPVSFKLPLNRRLEIEIYGRVVRDPQAEHVTSDLARKPAASESKTR